MSKLFKIIAISVIAITLFACSDDTNPVIENPKTELNELYTFDGNGNTFKIYSENSSIKEGFNVLYLSATDENGNDISQDLTINIVMAMTEMMHSTPFDYAVVELDKEKYIKIDATFIMPTIENGTWSINITDKEQQDIDEQIAISVEPTGMVKRFTIEDKSYFVTLRTLGNPKVGMNDFIISVHTRENMMSHPPLEDLKITIEPTMPSMGHGSDGNVNPVYESNGVYKGKVNFSMTGDWEVAVTLSDEEKEINTIVYEINL